jgi:hypothetical protein
MKGVKRGIIGLFMICLTSTVAFGQMIVKSSTDVDLMTVNDNGDVVIGTSSNNGALTLHGNETINGALTVSGLTTTTTLKITDGAAAGTILMSDADGDASWNSLSTLVDNNTIKVNGSNQLFADVSFTDTDNQNLGVGTGGGASAVLTIEGGNNVTFTAGSRISISESPTNRTITIGATDQRPLNGNAIVITNGREVNHMNTSDQGSSNNSGSTFIQDVLLDEYGHVTTLRTTGESDPQVGSISNNYYSRWNGSQLVNGNVRQNSSGTVIVENTGLHTGALDIRGNGLNELRITDATARVNTYFTDVSDDGDMPGYSYMFLGIDSSTNGFLMLSNLGSGKMGLRLDLENVYEFSDDAAAVAGGMKPGMVYKTPGGDLRIVNAF